MCRKICILSLLSINILVWAYLWCNSTCLLLAYFCLLDICFQNRSVTFFNYNCLFISNNYFRCCFLYFEIIFLGAYCILSYFLSFFYQYNIYLPLMLFCTLNSVLLNIKMTNPVFCICLPLFVSYFQFLWISFKNTSLLNNTWTTLQIFF